MTMKDKILHYFRDINNVYNDCTKYDTLKAGLDAMQEEIQQELCNKKEDDYMRLQYNIETLLFHLNHVKRMCESTDCDKCPFSVKRYGLDGVCFFMEIHEGRPPELWDFSELRKEGDEDEQY